VHRCFTPQITQQRVPLFAHRTQYVGYRTVYSARREADFVMPSPISF
jgi:hypothetical protein